MDAPANSNNIYPPDCTGLSIDGISVPILVDGGVRAKRPNDMSFVPLETDASYVGDILKQCGIVENSATIDDAIAQRPGLRSANDDGHSLLSESPLPRLIEFRQQYVLVTEKICEPLNTVKTADELIVVLSDAMRAHSWVLEHCSLLHRDISSNNIMVGRNEATTDGPPVYGMLIDFDCAIDPNMERVARPEQTGTKPFMSVPNLEGHPEQRTELDDWESLLYVLCWIATFGINDKDRSIMAEMHKGNEVPLEIAEWHTSRKMVAIAVKKRLHLHDLQSFTDDIFDRFPISSEDSKIPDYRSLQSLAVDLYRAMFQYPKVDEKYHGARKRKDDGVLSKRSMYKFGSSKDGGPHPLFKNMTMGPSDSTDNLMKPKAVDPFVLRTEHSAKTKIIKGLNRKLEKHAKPAIGRLAADPPK
ncbi:hypothetical protein GGI03_001780 [Coemansia sp. RSA 2337]|nr:hypothetical protein GGI03_001780 [Coemansia sp. RSA 2337]